MSLFFIKRPNFAWVVALFITLAGLLAIPLLPVSQYPSVAPPQITVTATYPGASAQVLVDSVTSVIEEELNGAKGLLYFESTSNSNGMAEVVVTFQPGTNPELAQVDVQNRLKKAEARMPQAVLTQGLEVEQTSAGFLLIYVLSYKEGAQRSDTTALGDYAARNINNELRRVSGVGKLQFFSSEAAMRVWIDPQKLVGYGLSIDDVSNAIRGQNVQVPAGSFGASPGSSEQELTATLAVKGTLDDPDEFGRIVLRANPDGSAVKLADVARLEVGSESYNFTARLDGKPTVAGAIQLSPGANALQTAALVKQRLDELSANFPDDVEYSVPYDTSRFVGVAIEKVIHTLIEAMVLVFLVMFLFLQNVRVHARSRRSWCRCACVGTLTMMYLLGFSVNMMTMFGMVLAIGILVDDAIVVVENVERIMAEEGLSPPAATVKAMGQVSGAIIGITLVLSAVFLPLAFMAGSVGVIYQQFSLSLAVSILFSGFLALTFTPALCATLLKPIPEGHHEKRGFFGAFNRGFARLTERYTRLNGALARRAGRYMLIYAGIVALLGYSYLRLPESFVPVEDQGYMIVDIQLPPGATRARTDVTGQQLEQFLQSREAVASSFLVMGFSFSGMGENAALAFPTLKDWSVRDQSQSAEAETAAVNERFAGISDGAIMAVTPPPIDGLGNSGGFSLRLQDRAGLGREALLAARDQLLGQANGNPKILYAMMEGLAEAPQLRLKIDREKARTLGVSFESISSALSTAFGSSVINDFANAGRQQRVVVQAEQGDRMTPEAVLKLYVPNSSGELVPLSAFVSTGWERRPGAAGALQRLPVDPHFWRRRARRQYRRSDGRDAAPVRRAANRHRLRVDRPLLPGEGRQRPGQPIVRAGDPGGVPAAGSALRELGDSAGGDAHRADRRPRRGARGDSHRAAQRRVLQGRPDHHHRPGGEECDPHRRVRQGALGTGPQPARRRHPGRTPALSPDHHDLHGVHSRRGTAGDRQRRRRGQPARHRHRSHRRHAQRHPAGGDLRAHLLRLAAVAAAAPAQNCASTLGDRAMTALRKPALMLLTLALSGCSLAPSYERPQAPVAQSWSAATQTGTAAASLEWQRFIVDPDLRQLVSIALDNNRSLRQTLLDIEQARAQYRIQRADRVPGLNGSANGNRQRLPADLSNSGGSGVSSSYQVGVSLPEYELDLFGRVKNLTDAALEQYLSTEEAGRSARIALIAEVSQAYLTYDGAQRRLLLTEQTLASRENSLDLISQRAPPARLPHWTIRKRLGWSSRPAPSWKATRGRSSRRSTPWCCCSAPRTRPSTSRRYRRTSPC